MTQRRLEKDSFDCPIVAVTNPDWIVRLAFRTLPVAFVPGNEKVVALYHKGVLVERKIAPYPIHRDVDDLLVRASYLIDRPAAPIRPAVVPYQPNDKSKEREFSVEADQNRYFAQPFRPPSSGGTNMDKLIGLGGPKAEIRRLIAVADVAEKRRVRGLKPIPVGMNYVFTGNPGTCKTTFARILGESLRQHGHLPRGHLVEVSRADLVAGWIGQTEEKTMAILKSAMGGVLYIDEFYSICVKDMGNDFGRIVVDTIVKFIEDNRDQICVIVSGYTGPMRDAIAMNPGLRSRFTRTIHFPDYSLDELARIFDVFLTEQDIRLEGDAAFGVAGQAIRFHYAQRGPDFGNARDMRTFTETVFQVMCQRIADTGCSDLTTATASDVEQAARLIGFG